jgi:rhomboid family GlyGly-CTERM serine protease
MTARTTGVTAWLDPKVAILVFGPLVLLSLFGHTVNPLLQYARAPILAGEWWRLVTGHFVHIDAAHLALNCAVILAWLYVFRERESPLVVATRLLAYAVLSGLGMLAFSPDLTWMLGASALTYALIAGSALRAAIVGPRMLGLIVLAGLAARIGAEQIWGLESWFGHFVDYPIATAAHGHGVAAGLTFELGRFIWRKQCTPTRMRITG